MSEKKRVGILGGTFNPVHIGHLVLAENAYMQFQLDDVMILPTKNPPHKQNTDILADDRRVEMINRAIEDVPYFRLSTIELERNGVSYTSDTLEYLKNLYPDTDFYFIMGADSLCHIESWKAPDIIMKCAYLLVAPRDFISDEEIREQINYLKMKYKASVYKIFVPNIEISSQLIRHRVQANDTIKYFVPQAVEEYIYENQLYK